MKEQAPEEDEDITAIEEPTNYDEIFKPSSALSKNSIKADS